MNSAGDTQPSSGLFQRSSASTVRTRAIAHAHDRLVVEALQLAARERVAQRALDRDPAPCPGVHAGGEEVQAVAQAMADLRIAASAACSRCWASAPS